jgi:hypothetical protein
MRKKYLTEYCTWEKDERLDKMQESLIQAITSDSFVVCSKTIIIKTFLFLGCGVPAPELICHS